MFFRLLFIWSCVVLASFSAHAQTKVVVTYPVLHSLTSMVMEGIGQPQLLLTRAHDTHHLQLRPSQMQMVLQADAIIYLNPLFETFVPELQEATGDKINYIRLSDTTGYEWLNPDRAVVMLYYIAKRLGSLDQKHAAAYRANAQRYQLAIDQSAGVWQKILKEAEVTRMAASDHNAFAAFTDYFGLPAVVALEEPNGNISMKNIKGLENKKLGCIFATHGDSPIIHRLIQATGARELTSLNPLGAGLTVGTALYFNLMDKLVKEFRSCLTEP